MKRERRIERMGKQTRDKRKKRKDGGSGGWRLGREGGGVPAERAGEPGCLMWEEMDKTWAERGGENNPCVNLDYLRHSDFK